MGGVKSSRQRNVFFYRAHAAALGRACFLDGAAVLAKVAALEWSSGERYLEVDGDHKIAVWEDENGRYPRFAFGYIRPGDDSRIDNKGHLRPALTQQGDGLTEFTYCVLFPENIVGVVFDAVGPRLKRIAEYLTAKCPDVVNELDFRRLVQRDFVTRLDRLGAITSFEISVHPSQVGLFDDIEDTISAALASLKSVADGETISVQISAGKGKGNSLSARFRDTLKSFLNKPIDRSTVRKLRITGRDQATGLVAPPLDLLVKQFVFGVNVRRPSDASGLSVDCFRAIESMFGRHSEELRKAAAIESDD